MNVEVVDRIGRIGAREWNRLPAAAQYPFLRHEFLAAAEERGCVSTDTGWSPCHLAVHDGKGNLRAAMPLYQKTHSWGEFVFDWAWAHAYQNAGLNYYPKLVSATPFTPATSPRLLLADREDAEAALALALAAVKLGEELDVSSVHIQFPHPEELETLKDAGLMLRKDCQFHWHNRGYRTFDDFLGTFNSAKRKKARRDRRHVSEQAIRFHWFEGEQLDAAVWADVYALISTTFMRRGSMPYLSEDFFCDVSRCLPGSLAVVMAERHGQPVAAAVFYRGDDRLYGRYWGSDSHYNALHFETCYYQGIDYCIKHGLAAFEPGTQGEHKISRGFTPVTTWSAHWLARPEFGAAIGEYLDAEKEHIERYIDAVHDHTPYRRSPGDDGAGS